MELIVVELDATDYAEVAGAELVSGMDLGSGRGWRMKACGTGGAAPEPGWRGQGLHRRVESAPCEWARYVDKWMRMSRVWTGVTGRTPVTYRYRRDKGGFLRLHIGK